MDNNIVRYRNNSFNSSEGIKSWWYELSPIEKYNLMIIFQDDTELISTLYRLYKNDYNIIKNLL